MPSSSHRAKHPLNHESSQQLPVHFIFARPTETRDRPPPSAAMFAGLFNSDNKRSAMSDATKQFRLPLRSTFAPPQPVSRHPLTLVIATEASPLGLDRRLFQLM